MTNQDKKLQLVIDSLKAKKVKNLEINYEYENVDTVAYLEIYEYGKKRPIDIFMGDMLCVKIISQEYPQFF